jgi:hypothetical protein
MAEATRSPTIDLDVSDDDTYESSAKEQSSTAGRIDALNYVNADHPLLPPRRARSANNMIEMRSRVWHHTAFWWDVFLAMQEDKNGKIRQQSAMDRVTIDYLSRATPSTRGMQKGSLETELEPLQNPSRMLTNCGGGGRLGLKLLLNLLLDSLTFLGSRIFLSRALLDGGRGWGISFNWYRLPA